MTYRIGARLQEWTIGELITRLSRYPIDTKVKIEDADTGWVIHKFDAIFDPDRGELCIHPSDYSEMSNS